MRTYELVIIFDAGTEHSEIRKLLDQQTASLSEAGAELGKTDHWGLRRFAYEMNDRNEGYYVVLQTRSEPAPVKELSRTLSLRDDVIRHRVVRIPDDMWGITRPVESNDE
ncbi:MAG: 30S ribosomal protein S6 [Actinobacteria bacterium]|nr:30S ribosomal protein S6 [Actinomycetota bacterium]MCB9390025.1 30S ribosomal protein S6 [Acidimicrobiia bacterium]